MNLYKIVITYVQVKTNWSQTIKHILVVLTSRIIDFKKHRTIIWLGNVITVKAGLYTYNNYTKISVTTVGRTTNAGMHGITVLTMTPIYIT